jgi:hypothetical protein
MSTKTVYESPRYKQLGFYVDGHFRRFSGGQYSTEDAAEIAVLDKITDVVKINAAIPEVKKAAASAK